MNFFDHKHYHLVGIKGVAMTSLAQLLLDSNKSVSGSDVSESFITSELLSTLPIKEIISLSDPLPAQTDCLIYTAAHQGFDNPQVQDAVHKNIPVYSHAEALSFFFNQKQGIAVCGVGGKSTVSAMITWILGKTGQEPSFSVGVGNIIGLNKTGHFSEKSQHFVAEADEYVTNPAAVQRGEELVPRFSYLLPSVTVCTHLEFDHPDVYRDESHTIQTFQTFFSQIKENGTLVFNYSDTSKVPSGSYTKATFGTDPAADLEYSFNAQQSKAGKTIGTFVYDKQQHSVQLQVPGQYNLENAAAACLSTLQLGISLEDSIKALASFRSTSRRFEQVTTYEGAQLYDDYAHHPSEIKAVLAALKNWYPDKEKYVAFQPHTYSRTKALFDDFAQSFSDADIVIILDIFASAREAFDETVTSHMLVKKISATFPEKEVLHLSSPRDLAHFFKERLNSESVALTVGAGDIYKCFEYLASDDQTSSQLLDVFSGEFPDLDFKVNQFLAPYTTVKIGGPAELFAEINNKDTLVKVVEYANKNSVPVTILGWGANSLISDAGIKGLVIKNSCKDITVHDSEATQHALETYAEVNTTPRWNASSAPEAPSYEFNDIDYEEKDSERVLVTLDAGVSLPAAINTLLAKGVTGLQWYSRIPASVGGAIYNNIHGGTHFIGEVLYSVDVLTEDNQLKTYTVDELELDYDYSRFHHSKETIISADFLLYKGDVERAQQAAIEWAKRKAVQPQNSLGCVFQNISTVDQARLELPTPSIGYLIQHVLKLQGYSVGKAQISSRHAAFIENLGGATAADYLSVIKKIVSEAKNVCNLTLKTEIFFLGFTEDELEGIVHSQSNKNSASA